MERHRLESLALEGQQLCLPAHTAMQSVPGKATKPDIAPVTRTKAMGNLWGTLEETERTGREGGSEPGERSHMCQRQAACAAQEELLATTG